MKLHLGDNLEILKNKIDKESIDLCYIDPPFNSNRNYYINNKNKDFVFSDIWKFDSNSTYNLNKIIDNSFKNKKYIIDILLTVKDSDKSKNKSLFIYLYFILSRVNLIYFLLKESANFYFHCDVKVSHYIKVLLDLLFGYKNFVNEIVWCYKTGGVNLLRFSNKHDIIFYYSKNSKFKYFNALKEKNYTCDRKKYGFKNIEEYKDRGGWFTYSNMKDYWFINAVGRTSKERTGYPTQKPVKLLKRIIESSCPDWGVVLDPFCGSGTTLVAAKELNRNYIGIDIQSKAIEFASKRLTNDQLQLEGVK